MFIKVSVSVTVYVKTSLSDSQVNIKSAFTIFLIDHVREGLGVFH